MSALDQAVEALMAGRVDEAVRAARKAVRERPDQAEAHLLLGEAQRLAGDQARCRESTDRALRLRPDWTPAHVALVLADFHRDFGRNEEAESRYRALLASQPDFADARFNLAGVLYGGGRRAEAVRELERLLEQQPEVADVRERLVQLLYEERQFDRLQAVCREGMGRFPRASVYPGRLGAALWFQGRHEEGLAAYAAALELAETTEARQDAALNTASSLLALGRHAEGWKVFLGREKRAAVVERHPEVVADPARLRDLPAPSRVHIYTEQGIGDELFFLRFAPALRARGHRLTVSGERKLAPLLEALPALFDAAGGPADFSICSGDLPLASGEGFAPSLALPVEPDRRERLRAVLAQFGPPPYIGVTWRGGVLPGEAAPMRGAYLQKSVPPEQLGHALRGVDARTVVLQRKPTTEDLRSFRHSLGRDALDLSVVNEDLGDAVALLSLLQDYVGVSNANMHLRAGIPGERATRVLVSMPADWRWGLAGRTSPWFPGFTVYRRAYGDDWTKVLSDLAMDLAAVYGASQQ